ncbi:MAG: 16S rRNA (cytidine(1402)-2'-O)-methyltransferase [Desulfobulbaceae bacterium]|nr:16S rRNA (cytidine(1402)-2'-O)-methyltransferase [Desulfobulbaceae bacterium]
MSRQHDTNNDKPAGSLYVVATPIGNLEDITARALRTLREVELIACEDTRHTRKLLSHFEIHTPVTSYYREKEAHKAEQLLEKIQGGSDIALVSDAGTPGISDPGHILVHLCGEAGIKVIPIPGPSALAAALSIAGLENSTFFFGGFPPPKSKQRCKFFQDLAALPHSLVFYETPHRIAACLQDCCTVFGERSVLVFRELTKIHEERLSGSLAQVSEEVKKNPRGEFVFIVEGAAPAATDKPEDLDALLTWYKEQPGMTLKKAVSAIAADLDVSRSLVYKKALAIWES